MKTFPNWRAVGAAMRWARQQHAQVDTLTSDWLTDTRWRLGGIDVRVGRTDIAEGNDLRISGDGLDIWIDQVDVARALRVLAALDLIPAHLADARDERYGRCQKCGRVARWWDDGPGFEPRWVHINPVAVSGPAAHRAEVAE